MPPPAPGNAPPSQALTIDEAAAAVTDYLRDLGPGFWLLGFGVFLILVGSVISVWSARNDERRTPISSPIPGEP